MDVKEAYRVLGLEMKAPRHEVVTAYRGLMLKWHPDRVALSGDKRAIQEANRMSQVINEAYEYLKNIAPTETPEASRAPKNNQGRTYNNSQSHRPEQKPAQRPTGTSPSDRDKTQSESHKRKTGAPRPEPASARSQADSATQSQPRPNPASQKKTSPPSSDLNFAAILVGIVTLTIILALIIFSQNNPSTHRPVTAQTQNPSDIPSENRVLADTHKITEQTPQVTVAPKGSLLATTNRANAIVEAARVSANGDIVAPAIIAEKKSTYERTLEQLVPGEYVLSARLNGWPEIRRPVTVQPGHPTEVTIEFKAGILRLHSIPSDATVYYDGTVLGRTPLLLTDLPPGERRLTVKYAWWPILTFTTTIPENGESTETILIPHGRLTVESTPAGATIHMHGQVLGVTPLSIEQLPVGTEQIELQADDYVTSTLSVSVEDKSDRKIHPVLSSSLKILDPNEVLQDSWTTRQFVGRDYDIAPNFAPTNASKPQNGVIRNLSRPVLDAHWLRQKFRYSAAIKAYDTTSGLIEFVDQVGAKSKYRVVAQLSAEVRDDKDFKNKLLKGAIVEVSGRLTAVEEPRWPLKTIVLQISNAQAVR